MIETKEETAIRLLRSMLESYDLLLRDIVKSPVAKGVIQGAFIGTTSEVRSFPG